MDHQSDYLLKVIHKITQALLAMFRGGQAKQEDIDTILNDLSFDPKLLQPKVVPYLGYMLRLGVDDNKTALICFLLMKKNRDAYEAVVMPILKQINTDHLDADVKELLQQLEITQ